MSWVRWNESPSRSVVPSLGGAEARRPSCRSAAGSAGAPTPFADAKIRGAVGPIVSAHATPRRHGGQCGCEERWCEGEAGSAALAGDGEAGIAIVGRERARLGGGSGRLAARDPSRRQAGRRETPGLTLGQLPRERPRLLRWPVANPNRQAAVPRIAATRRAERDRSGNHPRRQQDQHEMSQCSQHLELLETARPDPEEARSEKRMKGSRVNGGEERRQSTVYWTVFDPKVKHNSSRKPYPYKVASLGIQRCRFESIPVMVMRGLPEPGDLSRAWVRFSGRLGGLGGAGVGRLTPLAA